MKKYYLLEGGLVITSIDWDDDEEGTIEDAREYLKCNVTEITREKYREMLDSINNQ